MVGVVQKQTAGDQEYRYRVGYVDGEQKWEYLGPVHSHPAYDVPITDVAYIGKARAEKLGVETVGDVLTAPVDSTLWSLPTGAREQSVIDLAGYAETAEEAFRSGAFARECGLMESSGGLVNGGVFNGVVGVGVDGIDDWRSKYDYVSVERVEREVSVGNGDYYFFWVEDERTAVKAVFAEWIDAITDGFYVARGKPGRPVLGTWEDEFEFVLAPYIMDEMPEEYSWG